MHICTRVCVVEEMMRTGRREEKETESREKAKKLRKYTKGIKTTV